jgi:hypothetical protein
VAEPALHGSTRLRNPTLKLQFSYLFLCKVLRSTYSLRYMLVDVLALVVVMIETTSLYVQRRVVK